MEYKVIDFSQYTPDKFDEYINEMYNCTCKLPNGDRCMNCPSSVSRFGDGNKYICNYRTLTECYLRRFLGRTGFFNDVCEHDIIAQHTKHLSDEIDKQIVDEIMKKFEL